MASNLKKKIRMTEQEVKKIGGDILEGLIELEKKNIIHRDIKIDNVFKSKGTYKLADMGFAIYAKQKIMDANIGSPMYMAPEGLISGIYGPTTDVWSFGMLLI